MHVLYLLLLPSLFGVQKKCRYIQLTVQSRKEAGYVGVLQIQQNLLWKDL